MALKLLGRQECHVLAIVLIIKDLILGLNPCNLSCMEVKSENQVFCLYYGATCVTSI